MRLPLIIATAVLLVVGVLAGVVALGSAATADPPPVHPIVVDAPARPPAVPAAPPGLPQLAPAPRDPDGIVVPPPPVDDDDDLGDDDGGDDADDDGAGLGLDDDD